MRTLLLHGYHSGSKIRIERERDEQYGGNFKITIEEGAGNPGEIELDHEDILRIIRFLLVQ